MGRQRKVLDLQTGRISKDNILRKKTEENLAAIDKDWLRTPPDWLSSDRAKKEWKRITGELLKLDIIGNLDADALVGYCNALAGYIECVEAMRGKGIMVEVVLSNGEKKIVPNPYIEPQRKYADEMRKFARLCGITLDSRLKAASLRVDKEEDALEKEFGVI